MSDIKLQTVSKYLAEAFKEHNVSHRESPEITDSYDFAIDTGTARIILKFKRRFWEDNTGESIVHYMQGQHTTIDRALLTNKDASFPIG